jgi:hypothetical protein
MMHGVLRKANMNVKCCQENLMESGNLGETRSERTSCQFHQNVYVWSRIITCRQKNKVTNKVKLTFPYTLRWNVRTL